MRRTCALRSTDYRLQTTDYGQTAQLGNRRAILEYCYFQYARDLAPRHAGPTERKQRRMRDRSLHLTIDNAAVRSHPCKLPTWSACIRDRGQYGVPSTKLPFLFDPFGPLRFPFSPPSPPKAKGLWSQRARTGSSLIPAANREVSQIACSRLIGRGYGVDRSHLGSTLVDVASQSNGFSPGNNGFLVSQQRGNGFDGCQQVFPVYTLQYSIMYIHATPGGVWACLCQVSPKSILPSRSPSGEKGRSQEQGPSREFEVLAMGTQFNSPVRNRLRDQSR